MKFFAITCGETEPGKNSGMTARGMMDIHHQAILLRPIPKHIIIGKRRRFLDVFTAISHCFWKIKIESIRITTIHKINPWRWLRRQKKGTLLCTSKSFIDKLGFRAEKGRLYIIDTEKKTVKEKIRMGGKVKPPTSLLL